MVNEQQGIELMLSRLPLVRWWASLLAVVALPILLFNASSAWAEGSITLNPSGATTGRHFLADRTNFSPAGITAQTTLFVYVNAGETINLGSSALGIGSGAIRYTKPNGTTTGSCTKPSGSAPFPAGTVGVIRNRTEEKAGPLPNSGGYAPCTVTVGSSEGGLWMVKFDAPGTTSGGNGTGTADANWSTQGNTDSFVTAWDITVRNSGGTAIPGRVFTNSLTVSHELGDLIAGVRGNVASTAFIQTADGYRYRWKLNGVNSGIGSLLSNREGFTSGGTTPLFRSVQLATTTNPGTLPTGIRIGTLPLNPTLTDFLNKTHKIFLNPPDPSLPASASSPLGSTWLLVAPVPVGTAANLRFTGIEGTSNQTGTGPLSGVFRVDVSGPGTVSVFLDINNNGSLADAVDRVIGAVATGAGTVSVPWDGLDGQGNPVPATTGGSTVTIPVRTTLSGGEVHFPSLDFEGNVNGFIIEQLALATNTPISGGDAVFFDDRLLPSGGNGGGCAADTANGANPTFSLTGISSTGGAHKWTYGSGGGYGNCRGMDTWAFVSSPPINDSIPIKVAKADLEVVSKTHSPATLTVGQSVTYTVVVRNNGPSDITVATVHDVFPPQLTGLSLTSCAPTGGATCGAASLAGNILAATVALPSGATATYQITGTISALPPGGTLVNVAGIQRPADVTDPTATNPNAAVPIASLQGVRDECNATVVGSGNGNTPSCNNLKGDTATVTQLTADLQITKSNGQSNVTAGGSTVYTIVVTNSGPNAVTGATVADTAPPNVTFTAWTCAASAGSSCPAIGTGNLNNVPVSLLNGGTATFTVNANIALGASGTVANTASVTAPPGVSDPTPGNNSAADSDTVVIPLGTVAGTVFEDLNGNGVQDTGEGGLNNVTVQLIGAGPDGILGTGDDAPISTATTDGSGAYTFSAVPAGSYTVREIDPADVSSTTPNTVAVNVSGGSSATANFGDQPQGTVAGTVFEDQNGNGVQDPGEPGLVGVTVQLRGAGPDGILGTGDDAPVLTTATGSDGSYSFANVTPGSYLIRETDPSGYVSTTPNDVPLTVPAGGSASAQFGDQPQGTVAGTVFEDQNGNGVQDPGEGGLSGVTVQLIGAGPDGILGTGDDAPVLTTATGSDGSYSFAGITAGSYLIRETDPSGYVSTTPNDVSVNVSAGGSASAQFGDQPQGTVAGTVFNDQNGNGVQDSGEPGLVGVTVELLNNAGAVVATTTTAGDGGYSFAGVTAGSYTVRETDPSGFVSTTPNAVPISVAAGGSASAQFGDQQKGTVNGTVFSDINGNGVQDPGEPGLAGVTVELRDAAGTTVIATTTAAGDGSYSFTGVTAGSYTVREIDPASFTSTTPNDVSITVPAGGSASAQFGDQAVGSVVGTVFDDQNGNGVQDPGEPGLAGVAVELRDAAGTAVIATTTTAGDGSYSFLGVIPATYKVVETNPVGFVSTSLDTVDVNVAAGGSASAQFGDQAVGSVVGTVFNDQNGNGVQDPGEPGLAGVTVELRDAAGTTVIATTTAAGDGSYSFTGVTAGSYTVRETNPASFISTTPNDVSITVPAGGSASAQFGDQAVGSVAGTVFDDQNGNGVQDPGEPGLGGVTVTITPEGGAPLSVVTDSNGQYTANNVPAGNGTVDVAGPPGFVLATSNDPQVVTITGGGSATATPVGFRNTGTVTGLVFQDTNGNGAQDAGEPGLGGIPVTITNGAYSVTVFTDTNGNYSVPDVPAGTANVDVGPLPTGLFQTAGADPSAVTVTAGSSVDAGIDGFRFIPLPSAGDDSLTVQPNTPTIVSVLDNDSAGSGATLAPNSVDLDPSTPGQQTSLTVSGQGTFTANPDGTVTFEPESGFTGPVTPIQYTVQDSFGQETNPATIGVTVSTPADMTSSIGCSPDPATVGSPVTCTLTCTNNASVAATSALCDFAGTSPTGATTNGCPATSVSLAASSSLSCTLTFTPSAAGTVTLTGTGSASNESNTANNGSSQNLTVNATQQSADLSLTKTVDKATPVSGDQITYTLTVANAGSAQATGVTVADTLPAGKVTFVSASAGCSHSGGVVTCGPANVTAGGDVQFQITVTVTDATGGLSNAAQIAAADQPDPDSTPNNGTGNGEDDRATLNTPQPVADLELTNVVSNVAPTPNTNVTFTVTLTNQGPDPATDVEVNALLPAGYTLVSATPSSGSYDPITGDWTVGTLPATTGSNTTTLTLVATVLAGGSYDVTAQVVASGTFDPDSIPNNNNAVEDDQQTAAVNPAGPPSATDDAITVPFDTAGTFTGVLSNDAASSGATLDPATLDLDPGTAGIQTTYTVPGQGTFALVTENGVPTGAVTFTPAAGFIGTVSIPYLVADDQRQSAQANLKATVLPPPAPPPTTADVYTTVTVPNGAPAGGIVHALITYGNQGSSVATGTTYTITLATGLSGVGCVGATCSYDSNTGIVAVTGFPTSLSPGQTEHVLLSYTAPTPASGTVTLPVTSSITTTSTDSNSGNNTATGNTIVPTAAIADVTVWLDVPPAATPGSTVNVSVTFGNLGTAPATGVTYSLALPPGLTGVSCGGATCSYDSNTGIVAVTGLPGTLAPGQAVDITLNYTAPTSGSVTVAAGVNAGNDSNPGNNSASDSTIGSVATTADMTATVAAPATAGPGSSVAVPVTFGNLGPAPATGVTYSLALPPGLAGVSCGGATCSYDSNTGIVAVTGLPGTLAPGQTVDITLNYTAPTSGSVTVTASANAGNDSNPDNNNASGNTAISNPTTADVTATVAAPATAGPGSSVAVPVTFGNLGTAPATGVTYSLALPPGLTGVSCGGATCSYDSNTGIVTVTGLPGTLAPGQTVDITLNYTAPTSGSVTVAAGVNAGNDSNPDNNSASGRTAIIGAPVDIPALTPTALLALLALLLLMGWRNMGRTVRMRPRG